MEHIAAIQAALPGAGLDALVLLSPHNRRYATGFASSDGGVVVTRGGAWFFTDSRYIEAAGAAVHGAQVELVDRARPMRARIRAVLDAEGAKAVGAEERWLSHAAWQRLCESTGRTLLPGQDVPDTLRQSKDDGELAALRAAQRITDETFSEMLNILRPGMTEQEAAAELVYLMLRRGAERVSFDPIVVSGERSSMPHGVPGQRALRDGDFVTMDFGCVYQGYCSDMTRTVAIGHATDEMQQVYHTVLAAQKAGIAAAKPGVTGRAVHEAAAAVLDAAGLGEYFGHGFGHGVGLEIHESPNASPANETPMPERAVISAEPGVYLPGVGGCRIEDTVAIQENGYRNLVNAPKELITL